MGDRANPGRRRIPVILDTDIGGDIDDTWALAMMLRSPELDIRMVSTATGDTTYRAKIAARMLEIGGRTDIPIAVGLPLAPLPTPQAPWVAGYDLGSYRGPVLQDGVGALVEAIMGSPEPVTIVAIGPLPNIGAALEREPRIASRARLVGMHGSIRLGYDGAPRISAEYNVAADPGACRKVFGAPWDVTITPLDTCGLVVLEGARYRAVRDSRDPLARAVIENYRLWSRDKAVAEERSSVLFDTVAVYLAFSEELLAMERLGIRVTDEGYTVIDDGARPVRCATAWKDLAAFEDLLVRRLIGGGQAR